MIDPKGKRCFWEFAQSFVGMKSRKRFSCAHENIGEKFAEKNPTILNFFHILSLKVYSPR